MIQKNICGIAFELQDEFDFEFLEECGRVFRVFDQQDSGNICFGVDGGGKKYFVKLAGARPARSNTEPEQAVERLKATIPVYEALAHPLLLNVREHRQVPGGYIAVFEWFDGACMGRMYGNTWKFLALPKSEKLKMFGDILEFHSYVNEKGYVAIDFYDGSVMYNFETKETRICDIEFYTKMPYVNAMGRMWGSGRYMSPEEFKLGAKLDRRTNVFTMGAAAFQLFGGGTDRSFNEWELSKARYEAALRAASPEKSARYCSIEEFTAAWNTAE